MHASLHADRPGEAPAVAMEHRQRPEIDRMAADIGGEDVAGGEQVRAAMVVDDALGIAGCAGGVVERDRVPLVAGRRSLIGLVALRDQRLVVELSQPLAGAAIFGVVVVDDQRPDLGALQRLRDDGREFAVDDDRLGLPMIEHEGDRGRIEPGVERVQNRAAHRHAIVAFEHRRRVGEHDRDRVAPGKAPRWRARRRASSFARGTRGSCGAGPRARSRAGPETPPPRARERKAASAAGSWRGCGRGRGRKARGTSREGSMALTFAIIARPAKSLAREIDNCQRRKAKNRNPRKVTTIAAALPAATNSGRMAGVTAIPKLGASRTQAE